MQSRFLQTFSILLTITMLCSGTAIAEPNGITGRTGTNGTGCGGSQCHGSKSTSTTVSILQAVNGEITVAPGATLTLTLRVANAAMEAGGCDIGVKTTKNGLVRAGQLNTPNSSGLYLSGGELTHVTPRAFTDGYADFEFTWQAPANTGTYYLQAAGNAVNVNGSSSGDKWNFMEPVMLIVTPTSGVNETTSPLTAIFPVPAHDHVTINAQTQAGSPVEVAIVNALGELLFSWSGISNTDDFVFVWDGRANNGDIVPNGTYTVAVLSQKRTKLGRAIILH